MSNISVGQIIMDAQRMASRVKDLDSLGSTLLMEAEGNNRLVESLRQFQDDMDSLNRISNNKSNADMVNRIQQQNAHSSEILKENRELKICIEDYERAMELIMKKYREHTTTKVLDSKINFTDLYNEKLYQIIRDQREKINEMAAVMQRAASADDAQVVTEMETMARLRMENKTLRELLQISRQFGSDGRQIMFNAHQLEEKGVQTEANIDEDNDDDDDVVDDELSLSGASIENANNNSAIHISINSTAITDNALPPANENNNGPAAIAVPLTNTDCGMGDAAVTAAEQLPAAMSTPKAAATGNSIVTPTSSSLLSSTLTLSPTSTAIVAVVGATNVAGCTSAASAT